MAETHTARKKRVDKQIDALRGMGADDIALFLKEQGVKAVRRNSGHCAMAKWFSYVAGVPYSVGSTLTKPTNTYGFISHLPANVTAFIMNFDNGFYPELEEGRFS